MLVASCGEKMKILQINAVYQVGSTGTCQSDVQNYINNNTAHVCRTAFSYGGTVDDGYIIGSKLDRKFHGFFSRFLGKQAWFSKNATKKLIKYIDSFKPDIIQLGNLHGNFINFPMLASYIAKNDIATVLVLHDCLPFTGKCCHYTLDECFKWQTGCGNCPRVKKDNISWFLDRTSYLWKKKKELWGNIPRLAVVGVSKWIAEEAKKSPLMENAKFITYNYNGIDSAKFKPMKSNIRERYNLQDKKVLLGVASSWNESKGISDISKLAENLPDDCVIVLVGSSKKTIAKENVISVPATNRVEELVEWYSAADVFINISREESFGKVSAEALMCGTPVVCFDSTANSEIIGENCGLVCKTDNMEDYKNLVLKVLENGKEMYMQDCVKFANENFSVEKNAKGFLEIYEKILK